MVLGAQSKTADWLADMGLDDPTAEVAAAASTARNAFQAVVSATPDDDQIESLLELKTPEAIRHLTGMLTAYDWEFVAEAKRMRSFVVARLMEEAAAAGKAGDRIKALGLLGKVTEVGLFTEKVEVTKIAQTDEELDGRIKERLNKLRGVMDALPRPVADPDADIADA